MNNGETVRGQHHNKEETNGLSTVIGHTNRRLIVKGGLIPIIGWTNNDHVGTIGTMSLNRVGYNLNGARQVRVTLTLVFRTGVRRLLGTLRRHTLVTLGLVLCQRHDPPVARGLLNPGQRVTYTYRYDQTQAHSWSDTHSYHKRLTCRYSSD